jgi:hypothetical protein
LKMVAMGNKLNWLVRLPRLDDGLNMAKIAKVARTLKIVPAFIARTQLGQIPRRPRENQERFVVDKRGEPQAVAVLRRDRFGLSSTMRGIFVVASMSWLLGVCISQAGNRHAWEQEDTLKPRPKQEVTADETNEVKDGPSTERVLFGPQHMITPCDLPEVPGGARIVALAPNAPAYSVHRLDSITLSRAELPALSMRNVQASIEVTGADTETYSVQLCAQVGAATEEDATALLGQFKLARKGESFELSVPAHFAEPDGAAYVRIQAPRDAPVTISGKWPISVYGMSAPVRVSTTHARLTVADTTGDVEAAIKPDSGIIDFFGNRGHVRLNADWELTLVISAQFTGDLEGTAQGRIHVLLQPGFLSPFEAVVNHDSDFDCRSSICDQVRRADRGGKVAFTYGSGEPVLRLVSASGPVVINSTDRLPTEKDVRAELEAKAKAYRQAAIRANDLAGRIHSEADARELTDAIAKLFADSLPSEWVAERIRNRIAHGEYEAVADPWRLISEQRIADVWNEYVREIGAPDEALVNAAEIHNGRKGINRSGRCPTSSRWARTGKSRAAAGCLRHCACSTNSIMNS